MKNEVIIIFFTLIFVQSIEFKKNSKILQSRKLSMIRATEIVNLNVLKEMIKSNPSIILFHTEWCHHCKEFLPKFDLASEYVLTKNIEFYKVDCKHKEICEFYGVTRFPTMKVFLNNKEIKDEPPRDLEPLLEFVDKINSPSIIEIDKNGVNNFSKNYGETSFLILTESIDNEFYRCIENLANEEFFSILYFAMLKKSNFKTKNNKIYSSPALITLGANEEYELIYQPQKEINCEEIKEFININKYPLAQRLSTSMMKRIQIEKRILISVIISIKNPLHLGFLKNKVIPLALRERNFIYSHLDFKEDMGLLRQLRIEESDQPIILVYNFESKKYYIDRYQNDDIDLYMEHFNDLIIKIKDNKIEYSSGNYIEDLLNKYGIKLEKKIILGFFVIVFGIFLIFLVILVFYCGEKNEELEKQKIKKNDKDKKAKKE